jgi:hypothetical protein
MALKIRKGELTAKDMGILREDTSARDQSKLTHGDLRDYSLQHVVTMNWQEESDRDLRPFDLGIDGKKYTLSYGELKDMSDFGFFRREKPNPTEYRLKYFDGPKVIIDVELNEEAERDMIFRLRVDKKDVLLDMYELMRYGRFI